MTASFMMPKEKKFFPKSGKPDIHPGQNKNEKIVHAVITEMKRCTIRKIGVSTTDRDHDYCYVIILRKDSKKSFTERCAEYDLYLLV